MDKYIPPYDITDEMLELVSEITEDLGKLSSMNDLERLPRLRRVNRIRSIQSSLAIENNTLSLEQVTDVIDGKHVLGPQDDIIAVKNAFSVYKMLPELDPFSLEDLLKAHGTMMHGLVEGVGELRTSSVGVINAQGKVIHVAPPHDMVKELMEQLFDWMKTSKTQMLIRSSIFHYEFEFIHPFADGNGRTGRLWQTARAGSPFLNGSRSKISSRTIRTNITVRSVFLRRRENQTALSCLCSKSFKRRCRSLQGIHVDIKTILLVRLKRLCPLCNRIP